MEYSLFAILILLIGFLTWKFYNMKVINDIKGYDAFKLKIRVILTLTLLILIVAFYIFWFGIAMKNPATIIQDYLWIMLLAFPMHMLWPVVMLKNIYDLTKELKNIEDEYGIEKKCNVILGIILSLYIIPGIIYIQSHQSKMRKIVAS